MDNPDMVMCLHEGICPECKNDVKILLVEGTKPFLGNIGFVEEKEWKIEQPDPRHFLDKDVYDASLEEYHEKMNSIGGVGIITYKCDHCNKKFHTEKHVYGDWTAY